MWMKWSLQNQTNNNRKMMIQLLLNHLQFLPSLHADAQLTQFTNQQKMPNPTVHQSRKKKKLKMFQSLPLEENEGPTLNYWPHQILTLTFPVEKQEHRQEMLI